MANTTHVIRKAEHDLRRAVPPRRDVLGHEALLLRLIEPAREPEIANLEFAVRVHEQVAGLEIAVQHVGRVDVFQAAERLVDEGLEVRVRQGLTRTDLRELEGKNVRSCPLSAAKGQGKIRMIDAQWRGGRPP